MNRVLRMLAIAVAGLGVLLVNPGTARAECGFLDPWPSFQAIAPKAERVIVGKVVEDRDDNSSGYLARFGFRVDEVLRGNAAVGAIIEIAYLPPGPPWVLCPDTYLRPLLGDVLAIATGAPGPNGETLNSAAWIKGAPDDMEVGLGRISRRDLHALFGLPATDTAAPPRSISTQTPWALIIVAGLLGGLITFRKRPRSI